MNDLQKEINDYMFTTFNSYVERKNIEEPATTIFKTTKYVKAILSGEAYGHHLRGDNIYGYMDSFLGTYQPSFGLGLAIEAIMSCVIDVKNIKIENIFKTIPVETDYKTRQKHNVQNTHIKSPLCKQDIVDEILKIVEHNDVQGLLYTLKTLSIIGNRENIMTINKK